MRRSYIGVLLIVLVSMFAPALVTWAHHGDAGRYNDDLSTVVGVVAQWRMINPHSVLILDVEDESGKVIRWRGELGNPTNLGRVPNQGTPGQLALVTDDGRLNGSWFAALRQDNSFIGSAGAF